MRVDKGLVFLALAAILAWGTAATDASSLKIGVVDIDQAISSTEEGKAAREELARKEREAQGKIQPLIDRLRALEQEIKAKKFVLSDDALFQKQLDLVEMRNQIQNKAKEIENKLKIDTERLRGPLIAKLRQTIEEFGKGEGFSLILGRGTPGVLYTREALDVTDRIIEKYNQKS